MSNIFKMLFFDAIYGGPIANGFGFLVTLHDSRNPFRGTVAYTVPTRLERPPRLAWLTE